MRSRPLLMFTLTLLAGALLAPAAQGHHSPDAGLGPVFDGGRDDPSAALQQRDRQTRNALNSGPFASKVKDLKLVGRGERLLPDATTDVWTLGRYAYIGTFNEPCGDGTGANGSGVRIFDVRQPKKVKPAGFLPSVQGSRINDVKVAKMNSGTILVHSNESCDAGPGGFEIYDVSDASNRERLAHVQIDDVNQTLRDAFGSVDAGVHNLFLFTQGEHDYVAVVGETFFGNFQIFEITDPRAPRLVASWGAEQLCEGDFCSVDPEKETDIGTIVDTINNWLFGGFGISRNRFLHDITVSADGEKAYLSNWDAGLVLLDIADIDTPGFKPRFVSTAIGMTGDNEVNSHAAWPSEDGKTVVETEEDFDVFSGDEPLARFTFQERPTNTIPGVGISTNAGTALEENPGNTVTVAATSVTVDSGPLAGTVYDAAEGTGNQPKLGAGTVSGEAVFVGLACAPLTADLSGKVAIARRGECFFGDKLANAAAQGAVAIVIANNAQDSLWGEARIWDYSDPANPKLVSTIDTLCSKSPRDESCDPRGTYSAHNVIVEHDKAYFSWYSDGVLVYDISNPAKPRQTGRYKREGVEFEAQNGGIQDVWGIYKEHDSRQVYASDRNGGLYVLKETGKRAGKGRPHDHPDEPGDDPHPGGR
ncbi:MAG: PA domain-containing protein [Solirubrobacteraceae bacterium]